MDNKTESKYVAKRMSRNDDRGTREKLNDDALLRGSVGRREANRIIEAIDNLKSIK